MPVFICASAKEEGNILFTWTDNSGIGIEKPNDKLILVAYFPVLQQAIFSLDAGTGVIEHAVLKMNTIKGDTLKRGWAF